MFSSYISKCTECVCVFAYVTLTKKNFPGSLSPLIRGRDDLCLQLYGSKQKRMTRTGGDDPSSLARSLVRSGFAGDIQRLLVPLRFVVSGSVCVKVCVSE